MVNARHTLSNISVEGQCEHLLNSQNWTDDPSPPEATGTKSEFASQFAAAEQGENGTDSHQ